MSFSRSVPVIRLSVALPRTKCLNSAGNYEDRVSSTIRAKENGGLYKVRQDKPKDTHEDDDRYNELHSSSTILT